MYYRLLARNEQPIIDSCRLRVILEEEDEEEEDDDGNPNIFHVFVDSIERRVGADGIDFIRRCLSWSADERRRFLDSPASDGATMFGAALQHDFLLRFRSLM